MKKSPPDQLLGHAADNDGIDEYDNPLPDWWLGLFYLCILWAVIYTVHYHFIGHRSQVGELKAELAEAQVRWPQAAASGGAEGELVVDNATVAAGEAIFKANCVACHGADMHGGIGPNLVDTVWIHGGTPADIRHTITVGVPDKGMLTWGPILGPEKVAQVAAYVVYRNAQATGHPIAGVNLPLTVLNFAGNRHWVYAQQITGRFRTLRHRTSLVLQLILFLTPWLRIGGHPALMVDLPARRVYALGAMYTARDTLLLLLILLFLAFALFFFTSLFGRLWCGYACPQTVFLEEWIRPLEHWIEGSRGSQMKLDKGAWDRNRIWRKSAKWSLYALAAIVVSMTLGSYFEEARVLWTGGGSTAMYTIVAIFAAIWFLDFAWFREQFCNYLCPYARFQSALTDDESLLLVYETARGEPRGGDDAVTTGRCIECSKCVAVCPQGIDIRNGFQMECIACGACIDACDDVLGRLGHEGLIRYDSMAQQQGKKVRLLRPRTIAYGGLLGGLAAAALAVLMTRAPFEATVSRAPGSLFVEDADGWVRNTYLMRITNNDPAQTVISYTVTIDGLPGAQVTVPDTKLGSAESKTFPLVIRVPPGGSLPRTVPFHVLVTGPDGALVLDATFKTEAGEDDSHR